MGVQYSVCRCEDCVQERLVDSASEMLALLRRGADAVGALEADCDEAGVNCYPARHWWQDVDKLIERIEGRSE